MKLNFREYGSGNPIVLLHAFPLSSQMWNEQIVSLTDEGYRVITSDLPGFGETPAESEISRMEDLAEAVSDLLLELQIERAIIGGLSMGGYVALNFARKFPDKVSALLLADTSAAADSEEKSESRFKLIEKVKVKGVEILIDEMLPNVISEQTKSGNKGLVKSLECEFRKATENGVIAALLGMAERNDHTEFLKTITAPTLLIFGEDDKVVDPEAAKTLNREIANSTLIKIPNAGHYSNLEQPELFNNAFTDFLKKLK